MTRLELVKQVPYQPTNNVWNPESQMPLVRDVLKLIMYFCGPKSTLCQWAKLSKYFRQLSHNQQLWKLFCQAHPLFDSYFKKEPEDFQDAYKKLTTLTYNLYHRHFSLSPAKGFANNVLLGQMESHFIFLHADGTLVLMDPTSNTFIKTLPSHAQKHPRPSVANITFSSTYFAVSYLDGFIEVWERNIWNKISECQLPCSSNFIGSVEMDILDDELFCLTPQNYFKWQIRTNRLFYIYFSGGKAHIEHAVTSHVDLGLWYHIKSTHWLSSITKLDETTLILGDHGGRLLFWDVKQNNLTIVGRAQASITHLYCNHILRHVVFFAGQKIHFFEYARKVLTCTLDLAYLETLSALSWQQNYAFCATSKGKIFQVNLLEMESSKLLHDFECDIFSQAWDFTKLYLYLSFDKGSIDEGSMHLMDFGTLK